MTDAPPNEKSQTSALVFIFFTVLLDILALGVMIPVLPKLVADFVGDDTALAAKYVGAFATVWALMQFFCAPILGALSDRFGRRPVILVSSFGLGLDYIVMALSRSVGWLFIGRVLSGITASNIPTAYAYISDVAPPEKRSAAFGMLGAAFGVGFVIGPGLGGFLGEINLRLPFWVSAGLCLLNACYGLFVLPESLPRSRRSLFSWKRANPVGALQLLRTHGELLGLSVVAFLGYVAHAVLPSVFVLYVMYRYGWNGRAVALTLAGVGVGSVVVQAALVKPIVARLGERGALVFSLLCGAAGFAVAGFATTGPVFLLSIPLESLWGVSGAAVMGLMSARVSSSEQGQLQGANSSMRAMTEIIGPVIFAGTFAHFIGAQTRNLVPGAPWYVASALLGASALIAWRVTAGAASVQSPSLVLPPAEELGTNGTARADP